MNENNKRDYYEVLGINRNATQDEIKRAFRRLAKKYHPDMNPDDKDAEEKFKEINEAYSILSDKEKRVRYDQFGFAGVDPSYGGGGGQNVDFEDIFGGFGFGDIFSDFFGGGRRSRRQRKRPRRGTDLQMSLPLEFREAIFGCEKEITVKRRVPCGHCNGSGAEPGTSPERCSTCGGTGQVARTSRTPFGIIQQITECPTCGGTGEIIRQKCSECKGTGIVTDIDKIKVKIPAGIPDDVAIPLRGKGNVETRGAIPGDLYLIVDVKTHDVFSREGNNLLRDLKLDYLQLLFGDPEVPVMTLDGKMIKIRVPPGTEPGTPFRIKRMGVPILKDRKGRRGDLFITVYCDIPDLRKLPAEEKNLLKKLKELRLTSVHEVQLENEMKIKKNEESLGDKNKKKK
ncbi:MAG: molecular chaperone DnaJ [Promethearchaeota archaeon]